VSNRSRRINLDKDFDKLPKSVRRALNDCVWNWAADNVTVAWAPAKELVNRIKTADSMACTGSNLEDKPYPLNGHLIMHILRGGHYGQG
jgi:Family of unknown function (DUF6525)